jgi:hypothetical protein
MSAGLDRLPQQAKAAKRAGSIGQRIRHGRLGCSRVSSVFKLVSVRTYGSLEQLLGITEVSEVTHVSQLARALRRVLPRKRHTLVAVDGVDHSGKTPLAIGLAERLPATVISVDHFLNRHRGSYLRSLRWRQLRQTIIAQSGIVILEGVCVRFVLSRLRLRAFRHIYVKSVSEHGVWSDERECEIHEPIETFLEQEREDARVVERLLGTDSPGASDSNYVASFREEIIRYHASSLPSRRADFVFLRRPVMSNNGLRRTRRKRHDDEHRRCASRGRPV